MKRIMIIGAGITGSFIAHKLSEYDVEVIVIDKENDIANETTMANSAIVHTGYDPEDGTLKALLNVKGAKMYPNICESFDCDYIRCGAFVAANEAQETTLNELYERAVKREIKAELLSGEDARLAEPHLQEKITKVMSVPDTAVIYPWQLAIALMEEAVLNGTVLKLSEEVIAIQKEDAFIVRTTKDTYHVDYIINAAGVGAAKIASLFEDTVPFEIQPKKGQYFVLSKRANDFVHHIIYPTPTKAGKGVLCVPTTHGNTLLGPTSEVCEDSDTATTQEGFNSIKEKLNDLLKDVPYQEIIRSYSGVRACGTHYDFYISPSSKDQKFIHVACIDSPGLASSPAIADYVFENYLKDSTFTKKQSYQKRPKPIVMAKLSLKQKQQKIKENPAYGQMICRCEKISKQEIIDAIHRPCGATTIKGIKKRVRPGMGQCQGGFCEPYVAQILADELQKSLADIPYDSVSSTLGEVNKGETL